MKNIIKILICVIIVVQVTSGQDLKVIHEQNLEGNPEYHKQRKEWLESIHRSEPGVDYKILLREYKHSRMSKKNDIRKSFENDKPDLMKFVSDNGKIAGYWHERGSNNQSGRIHTADVDLERGLIYLASSGGNVWRGTLEGKNWTCLNNTTQFKIANIKVEKVNNNNRIIVFDEKQVFFSDNEGYTWQTSGGLENVKNWGWINRGVTLNESGKVVIYVLLDEWDYSAAWKQIKSLYYSDNGGNSFNKIISLDNTNNIDIWGNEVAIGEFYDKTITNPFKGIVLVHKDSIFSVDKSNRTLLATSQEIKNLNPERIRINGMESLLGVYIYFNMTDRSNGKVKSYISSDFGQSMNYINDLPTGYFMNNSFGVSKIDNNIALIGGVECFRTYDAGITWQVFNKWPEYYPDPLNKLHADIPGIKSFRTSNNSEFFLICTDGGIYKTKSDFSVENISLSGLNVSQYYSIYTYKDESQERIFAGSQDQGFQKSEIFSEKILDFEQTISGDYGSITSGNNGHTIWTVYPGFAMIYSDFLTTNKGAMWSFSGQYNDRVWMPSIVAVPGLPYNAYVASGGSKPGTSKIHLLEYDPKDNLIKSSELPYQFDANEKDNDVSALQISELNTNYLYAATKLGKFYTSVDGGFNWTESNEFEAPGYNYLHGSCIFSSKINLGTVYVAGSGYSNPAVYVSYDNGLNFKALEGLPPCYVYDIDLTDDEEVIFAATSAGPFAYIYNHKRWYDISGLDAPDQTYWDINYISETKTARFATYGRGIWDFKIESLITGVDGEVVFYENMLVFPNPSSDFFNIELTGNVGTKVNLKLVDVDGREVFRIFDGLLTENKSSFKVNFKDVGNIPSGVYLIILNNGKSIKYKKINYIK